MIDNFIHVFISTGINWYVTALERGHRLVMSIETIEENPGDRDEDWRRVGVGGGLSERDSVSRQRYIENSG